MTVTSLPQDAKRLTNLDGLRGLAALAVLLYHYTSVFPRFWPDAEPTGFLIDFGGFGVHLFFMISGFVILMTLEKRGASRNFIISRFIRLYPIFWICVCLTFFILISFPLPSVSPTWVSFFTSLTMLQDYAKIPPVDSVYWSLTYELGFYFFMFCLFRAKLEQHIEKVAAIWIIGTLTFVWTAPFIPHPLHYLTMINGYGHLFAAGLIIYKITQTGWTPLRAFLLLLVVVAQYPQPLSNYDDRGPVASFIIAGHIVLFLLAVLTTRLSVLSHPWLVFLGAISYPLYLVHHMIGYVLLAKFQSAGLGWWGSFLITTAMMIALSAALTYCADIPVRRWLEAKFRS